MSPFIVVVILIQLLLFGAISLYPLVADGRDTDSLVQMPE